MSVAQISRKYGILLGTVAFICTALSCAVYWLTKDKIAFTIAQQERSLLAEVIPKDYYDNDLLADCKMLSSSLAKEYRINKLCTAKKNQQISAYAYETIAPDGYSGNIKMLVAITRQGEVLGVRITEHQETPGLGDKIELRISDWVLNFSHKMLQPNNLNNWAVKKDGGQFDQFTGATITPRAVVNQVKTSGIILLTQLDKLAVENEE